MIFAGSARRVDLLDFSFLSGEEMKWKSREKDRRRRRRTWLRGVVCFWTLPDREERGRRESSRSRGWRANSDFKSTRPEEREEQEEREQQERKEEEEEEEEKKEKQKKIWTTNFLETFARLKVFDLGDIIQGQIKVFKLFQSADILDLL